MDSWLMLDWLSKKGRIPCPKTASTAQDPGLGCGRQLPELCLHPEKQLRTQAASPWSIELCLTFGDLARR